MKNQNRRILKRQRYSSFLPSVFPIFIRGLDYTMILLVSYKICQLQSLNVLHQHYLLRSFDASEELASSVAPDLIIFYGFQSFKLVPHSRLSFPIPLQQIKVMGVFPQFMAYYRGTKYFLNTSVVFLSDKNLFCVRRYFCLHHHQNHLDSVDSVDFAELVVEPVVGLAVV